MAPLPTFGTNITNPEEEFKKAQAKKTPKQICEENGGFWDEERQVCLRVPKSDKKTEPPKAEVPKGTVETFSSSETGRASGVVTPDGKTYLGLSPSDVDLIAQGEAARVARPENSAPVGTAQGQVNQAFQAQQLSGQIGQFSQLPTSQDPLLDAGQALSQGIVGAIPRALNYAITGAGVGLAGGAVAGAGIASPVTAPVGAAIGAVAGFVSGIASSMISEFKGQRTDTINAQKRVLDEGKQNLNDWATMAAADPANAGYYLGQYNLQLAQIDQAYRQMKYDTNRDVAKFEKALPDLAEFEAFYSTGGERDAANLKMQNSLLSPSSPEYQMLELAYRRKGGIGDGTY